MKTRTLMLSLLMLPICFVGLSCQANDATDEPTNLSGITISKFP